MSAAQKTVPVDAVVLNVLEERLCAVGAGISAIGEVLGAVADEEQMEFVSRALLTALAGRLAQCFEVLSEGRLLKAEREMREIREAADAARA